MGDDEPVMYAHTREQMEALLLAAVHAGRNLPTDPGEPRVVLSGAATPDPVFRVVYDLSPIDVAEIPVSLTRYPEDDA